MDALEKYYARQDRIIQEDKEKTLIALGLVEREYSPDGTRNSIYDKAAYDGQEIRYYREVAIKVTDEEYEQIIRKAEQVNAIEQRLLKQRNERADWALAAEEPRKSGTASGIKIFAWVYCIFLLIAGIILGIASETFLPVIICAAAGAAGFVIPYALAEILEYLAEK